jgi:hypothetical protein
MSVMFGLMYCKMWPTHAFASAACKTCADQIHPKTNTLTISYVRTVCQPERGPEL